MVQYWEENSPQATADSLPPVSDSDNIQNVVVKLEEVVDLDEINPRSPSTHVFDSDIRNVDVNMEEIADLEEDILLRAERPSTADAQTALDVDAEDVVVKLEEVADWEENNPQPTAESSDSTAPTLVSDSDVQNVAVKIEEIVENWDEMNPRSPLADAPVSVSNLDAQNIVVKIEEIDWEENQEDYYNK